MNSLNIYYKIIKTILVEIFCKNDVQNYHNVDKISSFKDTEIKDSLNEKEHNDDNEAFKGVIREISCQPLSRSFVEDSHTNNKHNYRYLIYWHI